MIKLDFCRSCKCSKLDAVCSLGSQTLSGVFLKKKKKVIDAPLELFQCKNEACSLVQLGVSCDPDLLYGDNYGYRSGLNSSMVKHLNVQVSRIVSSRKLACGDLVLDIGSNDGTLLNSYPDHLMRYGVDPTAKKFREYYHDGIEVVEDFFNDRTVDALPKRASVVTSFSMFYDLEDPLSFVKSIAKCLKKDGVWFSEQSYLYSMLKANSFDTICHEHLEYYSIKSIDYLLIQSGLKMVDVIFNAVNGGSFCFEAVKVESDRKPSVRLHEARAQEESGATDKNWEVFNKNIQDQKRVFKGFVQDCKDRKKTIYGLGASTKGNVLLQYFDIGPSDITAIGEVNPEKFGAYTPGTHIGIIGEDELLEADPDYLLVLPWHFKEFFLGLEKLKGRNLVFPLPEFEIVEV